MSRKEKQDINAFLQKGKVPTDTIGGMLQPKVTTSKTIDDIIAKQMANQDRNAELKKIFYGDEFQGISEEKKMEFALSKYTQEDIKEAQYSFIRNITGAENKADIVHNEVTQGKATYVDFYKNDVLTPQVAQAMESKGYIADADDLMDKLKMTDVYQQRKAVRKAKSKFIKNMLKSQKSSFSQAMKITAQGYSKVKTILKKKPKKMKKISMSSILKTRKQTYPKAKYTSYKIKVPDWNKFSKL